MFRVGVPIAICYIDAVSCIPMKLIRLSKPHHQFFLEENRVLPSIQSLLIIVYCKAPDKSTQNQCAIVDPRLIQCSHGMTLIQNLAGVQLQEFIKSVYCCRITMYI